MKRKTQKTISAFITLLLVLLLPVQAFAEEYNIANGDIKVTVNASGEQLVSQPGIADAAPQTGGKTTITGFSTDNIVTITVAAGQTANVTLKDLDIAHSGSTNEAAVSTSGDGDVNIELDGDNWLMSGNTHAGLEKNNAGTLTIGDDSGTVGSLTANGGSFSAGIGGGASNPNAPGGEGSNITISGGTVTANGGDSGAGIGGGYFGDGNDITISGGSVTAIGDSAGAGIGSGLQGNGSNVTVSGNSQVRVQGGEAPSGLNCGTGAGIGNGGYNNGGNGAEVEPDVSNLMSPGCVKYYAPGANMNTDAPIRVIFGKAEPHKPEPEPYNAPADSAYKIGETVIINGTAWIVIGIEGDVVELASFNAFSEEQLKDLENLIMNILTAAQLDRLIPDKTSGERVFLANEDIAKKYFNGEAGHITIKADISILD